MSRPLEILAFSRFLPRPDTASGDRRLVSLLAMLARRHRVWLHFIGVYPPCDVEELDRYRSLYAGLGIRLLEPWTRSSYRRALVRGAYDLGIFEFWDNAEEFGGLFRELQPWSGLVVDSVDLHFLREEMGVSVGRSSQSEVDEHKRRELATYRAADGVVVVSAEDREALLRCGDMPPMWLLPNVVELRDRPDIPRDRELLFVGGFSHAPNADGLLWFVRECWPGVRAGVPDARLTVIGSNAPEEVRALDQVPGVRFVGYVPETEPYLDRAAVSVAPLRFGAGMKGKVTEAMASGLPVATTSVGAQGLGAVHGEHLVLADQPEELAREIVGLLRDPDRAERIGRAGRQLVSSVCSAEAIEAELWRMTDHVGRRRPDRMPAALRAEDLSYRLGDMARLPLRVGPLGPAWRAMKRGLRRAPRPVRELEATRR